jgi:hypothetical protein
LIENPLALEILKGHFVEGSRVRATCEGERLVFVAEQENNP